jgi:hypothetical protein
MSGGMADARQIAAHRHSIRHRAEILASQTCGCFFCLAVFPPGEINSWVDTIDGIGQTAVCPKCHIDAVIGSDSGYPIEAEFLAQMRRHWFWQRAGHGED